MAKHLIHFLTNLLMSYTFTEAKGNCDTGFCQTYPFDIYGDALQEKELVAHVFYNSVTPNPVQCYVTISFLAQTGKLNLRDGQ